MLRGLYIVPTAGLLYYGIKALVLKKLWMPGGIQRFTISTIDNSSTLRTIDIAYMGLLAQETRNI